MDEKKTRTQRNRGHPDPFVKAATSIWELRKLLPDKNINIAELVADVLETFQNENANADGRIKDKYTSKHTVPERMELLRLFLTESASDCFGRYYGFPKCCRKAFPNARKILDKKNSVEYKASKIMHRGFVPCESCAKQILSGKITKFSQIITDRLCPNPISKTDTF